MSRGGCSNGRTPGPAATTTPSMRWSPETQSASSIALFYLGTAFAYFAVFPVMFGFLTATAPEGVTVMTDISKYLDFVIVIFFGVPAVPLPAIGLMSSVGWPI